jgi:outer membrane protein assembly factor BamB
MACVQTWASRYRGWITKALTSLVLLAPLSAALAACDVSLPFVSATPQQNCVAQQRGALGADGGVIIPLAARDPTSSFHTSALYALRARDGSLAWSCASTTYAGWDDVQMVNGVVYAIAGTEPTRDFPAGVHAHGVYAIRPQDGKQLWSYSFQAGSTSTLAFDGHLLFVSGVTADASGNQSALYAIHTDSGSLAWQVSFSGALGPPFIVAHHVIVPATSGDQALRGLREDNGATVWSKRIGSSAQPASPLMLDGALYLLDDNAATLTAIDGASGATRWTQPIPGTTTGQIVAAPGALIVPTGQGLLALDPTTGATRWSAALGGEPRPLRVAGQTIYAVSWTSNNTPDRLYALRAADGRQLWSRDVSKLVSLGLLPGAGDQIYLTEPTRSRLLESVVALDQRGGDRWRYDGQSPYNSGAILTSGDALYYIWEASQAGANPTDTTYVTRLRVTDGAALWQAALPALNADPVAPLLT